MDQDAVDGMVARVLDAGINFIDTADVYSAGESETMVGRAIRGRRGDVVLATKVRGRMGAGPNEVGLSRLHVIEAAEASLRRLANGLTSTSTRYTGPIPSRTSRRRSGPSTTSCVRERSATSGARTSLRGS